MRNGKDHNSCLFGEEFVSYIYDELPSAGRAAFEEHLLNCANCTSEFAAVSMSRLGVYEWHRDDFLPLETPVFAIPFERPVVSTEPRFGWLDALRGLFSPARLAAAGGAFAILAVAFGAIYVSTSTNDGLMAGVNGNVVPAIVETVQSPVNSDLTVPFVTTTDDTKRAAERLVLADYKQTQRSSRPIHATANKTPTKRPGVIQASIPSKAPRLGTYDEAEDTSLRLSDLVADIDTDDF